MSPFGPSRHLPQRSDLVAIEGRADIARTRECVAFDPTRKSIVRRSVPGDIKSGSGKEGGADTTEKNGLVVRRYWTNACPSCAIKHTCTTAKERRITRWEHEHILEAVQRRLDEHPEKMRQRRETVEHPFGTIKSWMGSTHFQMKTLKHVGTEMALHVLAYNMKRVMKILGVGGLMEAIHA
jgi:hypothetical protein